MANRAQEASLRPDSLELKRLAWAFALSAALHLAVWGSYSIGKHFHLWERLQLPAWLKKVTQVLKKPPPPEEMQPTMAAAPLIFVDVSQSQATIEKPKDTPFYSDKNAQAANVDAEKDTNTPKITGEQEQMVKTRDVAKNQFDKLMPALPSPIGAPVDEARARPTLDPGDLTLGKPDTKPRLDDGKAEKSRPRTVLEAKARQPDLAGKKMRQDGGVRRMRLEASLDTQGTPLGNYDAIFIQAVQDRWYSLIEQQSGLAMRSGKVVLFFNLNHDGRITNIRELENTTESDLLALLCRKGVVDPAPFKEWPRDMRLLVGKDSREIKFTFYYN